MENAAQLNYEMAVYKEQMQLIKKETERISLTTIDLSNALKAVENMKEDSVLIPIGGGALAKGTITESMILVPIGAQYMLEMERGAAKTELERRIDATKRAVEKLTEEFNKITKKLSEVSTQLRKINREQKINQRVDENIREDYI